MPNKPFEYTLNMASIFQGKLSELKSYYCREDIALALSDYDHAPKDAKSFRMRDLSRLCTARGLDAQELIADRTLLEQVPTRSELQDELLRSFYDMYAQFPATSDFMARIVRRLAPEYASDPVEVAILKKFVAGGGRNFKRFHVASIMDWAKRRLTPRELASYATETEEERTRRLLSKIDASIFAQDTVEMTALDILKLILDRIPKYQRDESLSFETIELSEETRAALTEALGNGAGDDYEQLQALYHRVSDGGIPDGGQRFAELVSGIERDFRTQLKTIRRISKVAKAGTAAELYKQAKKDAVKAKRNAAKKDSIDLELIEMCRDLAAGNFRVNGKTKVYLYYFAFMFGMTVPMEGRECAPERDLVKNLFQDFYNDNLLRLLSSDYSDPKKAAALEREPTGEGINYKSFVEVIYLYFLCREDLSMTPGEKIDAAEAVILNCVKRAKKDGWPASQPVGTHTEVYRELHVNVLLNKAPEEIADYILAHYQVFSPDSAGIARIMVAAEENTASDLIEEIMSGLDEAYLDIPPFDACQRADRNRGIKDDIMFQSDNSAFDWKVKTLLEERYAGDTAFLKVVRALDDRTHISSGRFNKSARDRMLMLLHVLAAQSAEQSPLSMFKLQRRMEERGIVSVGTQLSTAIGGLIDIGFDIRRNGDSFYLGEREYEDDILDRLLKKVSTLYYDIDSTSELLMTEALIRRTRSDKRVTRSELIAIHLNYYISLLSDTDGLDTFPDVFEDYAATIDPYLEEARYQPLSEKNIFDMYVVTALYFYLVENNGYM